MSKDGASAGNPIPSDGQSREGAAGVHDQIATGSTGTTCRRRKKLLKSGRSAMYSFVRFVNCTVRRVDIVWLNYEGIGIKYKTLDPEQCVDVNTFVGHPWIFRDSDTGDKLVVQLKEVYEPVGWVQHDGWPPKRKLVSITIPVYTLRECCIQAVRQLVKKDEFEKLEIPQVLKEELRTPGPSLFTVETSES